MITSSGVICDVCGKYILPILLDEMVNHFGVKGIKEELHCDNACKKLVLEIGKDWSKLPHEGRIYKAFLEHSQKIEALK